MPECQKIQTTRILCFFLSLGGQYDPVYPRGGTEKIFDELNNDFRLAKIPFSFLYENTVYMMLMAMCRNFYISLIEKISIKIPFIQTSFRLKKFILRFMVVPFKWIKQGGQKRLKLFTDKPYYLLN